MTYILADGATASTLTELANALGVDKVTQKDIKTGGKYADLVTVADGEADELAEATSTEELSDDTESAVEASVEVLDEVSETGDTFKESSDDFSEDVPEGSNTDEEPPLTKAQVLESMPKFENLDELKDFIKDINTELLEELAGALGCEWTPNDHAQIHRMRVALSMHHFFFPELFQPKEAKKKGKYGDKSDTELEKMAKEHKLTYIKSGNQSINRMRLIMSLKQAGHLAE